MCLIFVSIYMVPRYKSWYDSDDAHSLILLLLCPLYMICEANNFHFHLIFQFAWSNSVERNFLLFLFPSFFSSWTCFMSFSTKKWQGKSESYSIILWARNLHQLLLNFHNNFLALWACLSCCWDRLIWVGKKICFFFV